MARPMLLIRQPLLTELYSKYRDGVPVSKLIAQHALGITPPTLTKLLMYMDAANEAKHDEVGQIIYASLFPEWLQDEPNVTEIGKHKDVVLQSPQWRYTGKMPIGNWERNEWSD